MKKGLLSILAGALLVVGCQNYDDQFDQLESQINALASTVAGLSAVQSDLAALSAQVNSLSGAVDAAVDSALAGGLADIQTAIDALNAAAEEATNNTDIGAIQDALDDQAADLDQLLQNSSVFQGNVIINSEATLETYDSMGSAIAIVNGYVDIDAKTTMDTEMLQRVVDNIQVTTKQFDYQAESSAVTAINFNELTGTQTLTIKQAGDYLFQKLGSATVINLDDSFKSKVTKIDFRELTSITKFQTSGTDNQIVFTKAMELHLTKLVYYPPLTLTIETDEGAAMPFVMDDIDGNNKQKNITLDIKGPASLSISNLKDGSLTFTDIATVAVNGFEGSFTINEGVESFTADKVTGLTLGSDLDLETLDITGAADPDVTADKNGPSGLTFSGVSSLETITIAGVTEGISIQNCGNVTDITISADVDGVINIGGTTGNSDLTTVTLTDSKSTGVNVSNNADLETLTIDTTFRGAGTKTTIDGDIDVVDNSSLESLTVSSDKVENLTVTGNDDLTTVDFTGITVDGSTGTPDVDIYDNDLEGSLDDEDDTASTKNGAGEVNDLGSVSTDSGLNTIKAYLAHIDGAAGTDAKIAFDTVDFTNESEATSEVLYDTNAAAATEFAAHKELWIAYITPNTADSAISGPQSKRSYLVSAFGTAGDSVTLYANSINLGTASVAQADTAAGQGLNVNAILGETILSNAEAAGITLTATAKAAPFVEIQFSTNDSADENSRTTLAGDKATFASTASDTFTLTVAGSNAVTISSAHTTVAAFTNALANAWLAANSTAALRRWTVDSSVTSKVKFTARDVGTSQIGSALTFAASIASQTNSNVGYIIGNDLGVTKSSADNVAAGKAIVITMEADTAGDLLSEVGSPAGTGALTAAKSASVTASGVTVVELVSTLDQSKTASNVADADSVYPTESRSDVVIPFEDVSAGTTTANTFNREGWLSN